jgi:hypothetical protein
MKSFIDKDLGKKSLKIGVYLERRICRKKIATN